MLKMYYIDEGQGCKNVMNFSNSSRWFILKAIFQTKIHTLMPNMILVKVSVRK